MRKVWLAVALTLGLAGCAQLQTAQQLASIATASYTNPVTKERLYEIEASLRIAAEALLTYRRACIANAADLRCRENIAAIQPYTIQAKALLPELRSFVMKDDQVNALVVYKRIGNLYNTIVNTAAQRGVNIGSTT